MSSGKQNDQWKTKPVVENKIASGKPNYISMKLNLKLEPVLTG